MRKLTYKNWLKEYWFALSIERENIVTELNFDDWCLKEYEIYKNNI